MSKKLMVLLFITIIISTVLFSNGCASTGSNPEATAKAFIESVVNKKPNDAVKLCANNDDDMLLVSIANLGLSMTKDTKFSYIVKSSTDKKAIVEVNGSKHFCNVELKMIGDAWKITYVD